MQVAFALFADAANLSQEGKLNILGVFDALHVGQTPIVHPRAHLVVRFKATPEDAGIHELEFQWVAPDGTELWSTRGELEVSVPPPGVEDMDVPFIAAVDLPIPAPGSYRMHILLDGSQAEGVELDVYDESLYGMSPRPNTIVS